MCAATAEWPSLPFTAWADTCETLHLWTQIVGKTRLALDPPVNHWWHVTLYVSARGLRTSPMPIGERRIEIEFDLRSHRLTAELTDGSRAELPLRPMTVRDFHHAYRAMLAELGVDVAIWGVPVELVEAIPFEEDVQHRSYDAEYAERFWRVLLAADRVLQTFRGRFLGKASPVHFFWGSFDLAVTRFSGRPAPPHPGGVPHLADWVVREAYSHEVSSCGFWPGNRDMPEPIFYAYAYPEPSGFAQHPIGVDGARYDTTLREFVLPYETLRTSGDPEGRLLDLLQQTYEAAAIHGAWDRTLLRL